MTKKTITLEISVESDDLNNTAELCTNYLASEFNSVITKAHAKFNTKFFKVCRASITSNMTYTK
jgi:hypothetical protein